MSKSIADVIRVNNVKCDDCVNGCCGKGGCKTISSAAVGSTALFVQPDSSHYVLAVGKPLAAEDSQAATNTSLQALLRDNGIRRTTLTREFLASVQPNLAYFSEHEKELVSLAISALATVH